MENNQRVVDSCFYRMQARNGLTAKNQSQLGKLIPMLQLGAKNSKDGEAGLASLSDRMSSLRALIDRSREAFRRLPTMGTVSKERQLKRLTDALAVVKSLRDDGVPQGTAKALRALKNELTSLREIAYLGELNEETLDLTALRNWDVLLVQLLETSQTRFDEQRMLLTSDQEEQTPALSESELKDPVFSPKMKDVLNTVSGSSGSLPKPEAGAPFTLGRTSVIPVPKTMIDERVLKARGFKYQNLGGYFVLADQVLVTIDPASELTIDDVLKSIRKNTKQRYAQVVNQGMPLRGHVWHWIMREPELDAFTSAFPAKSLQLRNWGFC